MIMENNPNPNIPKRKPIPPRDLILIALAVLVMTRIDWANMNSFHYLILFLLVLCFMLRWSNMRKDADRKQKMEEYRAAMEAKQAAEQAVQAPAEEAAEPVSAADMTVDGEALPTEDTSAESTAAEEKTEL